MKMADPAREVYVMVGDGSYLMMSSEIVTSIQEGYKSDYYPAQQLRLQQHRGLVASRSGSRGSQRITRVATRRRDCSTAT